MLPFSPSNSSWLLRTTVVKSRSAAAQQFVIVMYRRHGSHRWRRGLKQKDGLVGHIRLKRGENSLQNAGKNVAGSASYAEISRVEVSGPNAVPEMSKAGSAGNGPVSRLGGLLVEEGTSEHTGLDRARQELFNGGTNVQFGGFLAENEADEVFNIKHGTSRYVTVTNVATVVHGFF